MTPHFSSQSVALHHGDCLAVMAGFPDNSVDSIVTDPPYGLGFMGKAWDELPPGEDWARECLRVLKPGGHLLAFGGTRTWHRLACAVEDAGFEVRDSIAWLYGSGFPKSLDVSKAIDKRGGADIGWFGPWLRVERRRRGISSNELAKHFLSKTGGETGCVRNWELSLNLPTPDQFNTLCRVLNLPFAEISEAHREVTGRHRNGVTTGDAGLTVAGVGKERHDIPATDDARKWAGFGTALKPAFEPVVVARKPLIGTVAANVLTYGTGALNIDATRNSSISSGPGTTPASSVDGQRGAMAGAMDRTGYDGSKGRWPANVVLDDTQAAALDQQTGELSHNPPATWRRSKGEAEAGMSPSSWQLGAKDSGATRTGFDDTGGASRFFYVAREDSEWKTNGVPADTSGGYTLTPSGLSASTAPVLDSSPRFLYQAKAPKSERPNVDGTAHPTVKPLTLMRWLVRLVTPPGGTVLEPFAGSGTTVEACLLEGFRCIAIEKTDEYLPLILARIERANTARLADEVARTTDPETAILEQLDTDGMLDFGEAIA